MKNRIIADLLEKQARKKHGRIMVLTGARQTGKTTLVKHLFKDYSYISLEDPITRSDYTKITASQWMELFPKAILDEVQKLPGLIESIKAVYDQSSNTRYILLGSSQLMLMNQIKESLAGRCQIMELLPLTLPEILTDSWEDDIKPSLFIKFLDNTNLLTNTLPSFSLYPDFARRQSAFEQYLQFGAYPAICDKELDDSDKKLWLKNYIRTYLEKDIRDLAGFQNLEPFLTIQKLTAIQTACLLNFSQLAKESGITSKTSKQYLRYLEMSYQIILLQPWHRNNKKRLVKAPKAHYLDPGILNTILKKEKTTSGMEYESAVISEIYKQAKTWGIPTDFYHLRTHDGAEVDLILEFQDHYIAFEIKMSRNITARDCRHLRKLDEILDKPVNKAIILSNDPQIKSFGDNIFAIPAAMFLS